MGDEDKDGKDQGKDGKDRGKDGKDREGSEWLERRSPCKHSEQVPMLCQQDGKDQGRDGNDHLWGCLRCCDSMKSGLGVPGGWYRLAGGWKRLAGGWKRLAGGWWV